MSIEGDWKGFTFKMAKPLEDTPRILEFLRKYFYPDAVFASSVCKTAEQFDSYGKGFEPFVIAALEKELSFYVEHKGTKKIVGVRLITVVKKDEPEPEPELGSLDESRIAMNEFLYFLEEQCNLFSLYPDIDCYGELFMTATKPEFRGQGLATEMYSRALTLMKSKGIPICKTNVSSPFARKACEKLGFENVSVVVAKDYKDKGGNCPLAHLSPDVFVTVMSKRII